MRTAGRSTSALALVIVLASRMVLRSTLALEQEWQLVMVSRSPVRALTWLSPEEG